MTYNPGKVYDRWQTPYETLPETLNRTGKSRVVDGAGWGLGTVVRGPRMQRGTPVIRTRVKVRKRTR